MTAYGRTSVVALAAWLAAATLALAQIPIIHDDVMPKPKPLAEPPPAIPAGVPYKNPTSDPPPSAKPEPGVVVEETASTIDGVATFAVGFISGAGCVSVVVVVAIVAFLIGRMQRSEAVKTAPSAYRKTD